MAKLFKKIANNINGLSQVYNDSSITSTVLSNIQELASANPIDSSFVENTRLTTPSAGTIRIKYVYDMYTGNTGQTQTIFGGDSSVQLGTTVQRKRLSDFYNWFPTNNPYITVPADATNASNRTLVEIKPYGKGVVDTNTMKQDSRQVPIVSGPRDEKRIGGFLKTTPGILFLAMQQTLQGGNTFKQTRRYDPTSALTATAKYTLASLTNPLERIDRILNVNTDNAGRLQQETVIDTQKLALSRYTGGGQVRGSNRTSLLGRTITTAASRFVQDVLNKTNVNVFGKKINLGQLGRTISTYAQTLNSIARSIGIDNATLKENQTAYDKLINENLWPLVNDKPINATRNFFNEKDAYIKKAQENLKKITTKQGKLYINTFTAPYPGEVGNYRSSATYTDDVKGINNVGESNGITSAKYVKDPMNYFDDGKMIITNPSDLDGKYANIDFIKFKIVVPTVFDGGISFRAFIKDIKHNGKGDFEEQRYIGRPERFIVYKGMNRSMTFTMYLVAFGQDELTGMWTRANMLNKLVYPINSVAGYMVPPIIKMTIGNILNDQPGYITDINMNLADFPWDIDGEVTNVVELSITYNILEKNYITQTNTSDTGLLFANELINPPGHNNVTSRNMVNKLKDTAFNPEKAPSPVAPLGTPIVNNPLTGQYDTTARTNQIKINPYGLIPGNAG